MSFLLNSYALGWIPTDLGSSLALWLDAADTSTLTLIGASVTEWRDKSGSNRHASQASTANCPTYQAAGFNSRPTLSFDGTNDNLRADAVSVIVRGTNTPFSVVGVMNASPSAGTFPVGFGFASSTSSGSFVSTLAFDSTGLTYFPSRNNVGVGSTLTGTTSVSGLNLVSVYSFTGTTGTVWHNGSQEVTGSLAVGPMESGMPNQAAIGALPRSTVGGYLNFRISELIAVNTALSTENRQRIEGYLAHKWGLVASLPSNHPYKTVAP